MNWDQKFAAINALGEASLMMRKPGNWYVSQPSVEVKEVEGSGVLTGRYGNGTSPACAIEDHWRQLTENLAYVVTGSFSRARKHYLWNGFMWQELPR